MTQCSVCAWAPHQSSLGLIKNKRLAMSTGSLLKSKPVICTFYQAALQTGYVTNRHTPSDIFQQQAADTHFTVFCWILGWLCWLGCSTDIPNKGSFEFSQSRMIWTNGEPWLSNAILRKNKPALTYPVSWWAAVPFNRLSSSASIQKHVVFYSLTKHC